MPKKSLFKFYLFLQICCAPLFFTHGINQTQELSRIYNGKELPFKIKIERADFSLPFGLQSFVSGKCKGKWLFISGRMNGMHGFNDDPFNFPPNQQNFYVLVVDPIEKQTYYRSLFEPGSGLTQEQIDSLSMSSPQFYQERVSYPLNSSQTKARETLYISGGYGYQRSTQQFITWPYLTAIDIEGLMHWVINPSPGETASQYIRQTTHPMLAVTGGAMDHFGDSKNPTLLCMGQDFEGAYSFGVHSQRYTEQIRTFFIHDDGTNLSVEFVDTDPFRTNPNFRRRDLNICRILRPGNGRNQIQKLVAFSGVFTPDNGVWTIPIVIEGNGNASMEDSENPRTFKQAMQQYACANIGLYSEKSGEMYNVLLGGITYGYFSRGKFTVDEEIPFTNQVTVIKSNKKDHFKQYFLRTTFPPIYSQSSNPGNLLLFGAGAQYLTAEGVKQYWEDVLKLDKIKEKTLIGYIIGGIQSSVPNTETMSDSAASPYIFQVILTPKKCS